jgi:DNA polymerase mu
MSRLIKTDDRGYQFRAGLRVANTDEEINFETERQIFQHLGLKYVPPELRNADG